MESSPFNTSYLLHQTKVQIYQNFKCLLGVNEYHIKPKNKILDWSKFKRFADNRVILDQIGGLVYYMIKNIVEKRKKKYC